MIFIRQKRMRRIQASLLERQGIETTIEWNPGNHFKDADIRTAKAFLWAASSSKIALP
ncbi:MAG: hypothetical protein IJ753_00100 [Bacteroidales bacterium]|nr:hypothetical protein [Bacteroidales bacterium]MBR1781904.1 hypothetical protein [Bacteroidales bacterium]